MGTKDPGEEKGLAVTSPWKAFSLELFGERIICLFKGETSPCISSKELI
jgi:hypothetical protein